MRQPEKAASDTRENLPLRNDLCGNRKAQLRVLPDFIARGARWRELGTLAIADFEFRISKLSIHN